MEIKVKYFDKAMPKLVKEEKGDWIDLSVVDVFVTLNDEDSIKYALKNRSKNIWTDNKIHYNKGDVVICRLGVAIELPEGKKANIYPRSSTFASWGLLLSNAVGCIDYVYNGDTDEWLAVFYATRKGTINKYDRLCQFDIVDRMDVTIAEVEKLGNKNRNGYGTTGKGIKKK